MSLIIILVITIVFAGLVEFTNAITAGSVGRRLYNKGYMDAVELRKYSKRVNYSGWLGILIAILVAAGLVLWLNEIGMVIDIAVEVLSIGFTTFLISVMKERYEIPDNIEEEDDDDEV